MLPRLTVGPSCALSHNASMSASLTSVDLGACFTGISVDYTGSLLCRNWVEYPLNAYIPIGPGCRRGSQWPWEALCLVAG